MSDKPSTRPTPAPAPDANAQAPDANAQTPGAHAVWDNVSLQAGEALALHVGASHIAIGRAAQQWQVAHRYIAEVERPTRGPCTWQTLRAWPEPRGVVRHVMDTPPDALWLRRALPDRVVVARPVHVVRVPARARITLHVGVPLFAQLWLGTPPDAAAGRSREKRAPGDRDPTCLLDVPLVPLSETWLGKSVIDGQLAFAARTGARLSEADVPTAPHRAITCVHIENRAKTPLELDRLALPAPRLSLVRTKAGGLFTDAVTLVREDNTDMATVRVGELAGRRAGRVIAGPRARPGERHVMRAFSRLLRMGRDVFEL